MSGLESSRTVKVVVTMNEDYAGKLERAIQRALTAFQHLDGPRREQLVSNSTVDYLLALRTAIINQLPEEKA